MSLPLALTWAAFALGFIALCVKAFAGMATDPIAWVMIALGFGVVTHLVHENRVPRRPRPKPSSDRMAVGE